MINLRSKIWPDKSGKVRKYSQLNYKMIILYNANLLSVIKQKICIKEKVLGQNLTGLY